VLLLTEKNTAVDRKIEFSSSFYSILKKWFIIKIINLKLFFLIKLHRRNYEVDHRDYYMYVRDRRISGSEYIPRGLESLDKPLDLEGLKGYIFNDRLSVPFQK